MSVKLVFFDIDQTLHRKETGYMPNSAKLAVRSLREKGILTAIASGRTTALFPNYLNEMIANGDFSAIVAINGQLNLEIKQKQKKIISSYPIEEKWINKIKKYFLTKNIPVASIGFDSISLSIKDHPRVNEAMRGIFSDKNTIQDDLSEIYQILIYAEKAEIEEAKKLNIFPENYQFIRWHQYCTDFLHKNGAKFRGILDICKYFGISPDETMAFGDGHNDLEMIKNCAIGVAMRDSRAEILEIADYVTGTVEEDGIYNALKYFKLI